MTSTRRLVIYTRFSSDLQSNKSCIDQEREIRDALDKLGIDHSSAIVIHDEAESGTKTFRAEFARLEAMVRGGEIAILAVDDQARLTRADNAFGFITDLVYSGGRFISTGEGIDTEQTGWELRCKVMELHNSTTIKELGRRVRRGQLGRVLTNLSAGDLAYGYESFFIDPEKAASSHRGPKPEKGVRINEEEAKWIRQIFDWLNGGRSIAWISRELTRLNAPTGRRRRSNRWRARHVRGILENSKYVGVWRWGLTRLIRNSLGKKKQIPVPKDQQIVVERPELRIIDADVWDRAQRRLQVLNDIYGRKPGQKERGPRVHHTALYPGSLLGGLVFCSKCGARMWQIKAKNRAYLACSNRGDTDDGCDMTTRVPVDRAEDVILEYLAQVLIARPKWVEQSLASMRSRFEEAAHRVPEQMKLDERRLRVLRPQIDNLVDAITNGNLTSQALQRRLTAAEREEKQISDRVKKARTLLEAPVRMPDDEWIQRQLEDMASIFREDEHETALLLRKLIKPVTAEAVIAPGKSRGYARLRFRINGEEVVRRLLEGSEAAAAADHLLSESKDTDFMSDEVVLDLGGPTKMEHWAPKIAEMRERGIPWKEIWKITGLGSGPAYVAWKRYVDAQQTSSGGPDVDGVSGESDDEGDESSDEAA